MTCFMRKYCQSLEQTFKAHKYNTQRKMDIHVKLHNTEVYKKSVINMSTKVYNNLPGCIKEIPYFSIDNAHLMYNAHPKLFRHSF